MVTKTRSRVTRYIARGFSGGLGHLHFDENNPGYAIGTNCITRSGPVTNGLAEVVEPTGIAAGYRGIKQIVHNGVNVKITHNGTDSRIYRIEAGVWALKETVVAALCTDVISFEDSSNNEVLAWCFAGTVAFRYSTNDGTTWTASTFAGTSNNPKFFLSQQNNLTGPRVLWVVNPNQLYFASSLINGTTVTTSSEVGDDSDDDAFTSLTQNTVGVVYIGKKNTLYAYANGPSVIVHGPIPLPLADAGGQSDRDNFENPKMLSNGTIVYQVGGYDLIGIAPDGTKFVELAPRWQAKNNGFDCPMLDLPINAIEVIGDNLVVALGDGDATTTKDTAGKPGGTTLVQNTLVNVSQLYSGVLQSNGRLIWHGSELTCTSLLRGMTYDDATGYLYLHSGASESVNLQSRRCYYFLSEQASKLVSSNLQLNTAATGILESALFGFGDDDAYDVMTPERIRAVVTGMPSGTASVALALRWVREHDTTATYTTVETYTNAFRAEMGTRLSGYYFSSPVGRVRITITADAAATPDEFPVVHSFELDVAPFSAVRHALGAL